MEADINDEVEVNFISDLSREKSVKYLAINLV
jgi:hypothetical protein